MNEIIRIRRLLSIRDDADVPEIDAMIRESLKHRRYHHDVVKDVKRRLGARE